MAEYTLPPLPYAYDALEPHISAQIMTLHHAKHHATYVANLNAALAAQADARDIPAQIALQAAVRFNGGGHMNHTLFWANLAPPGTAAARPGAAPALGAALAARWGSLDAFRAAFEAALLGIQGSGWGWLVRDVPGGALRVVTTRDQDPLVDEGVVPVLGVDMWEHAYYLQYLNGKAAYVKNIWNVVNWQTAEERFVGGRADVFAALRAAM